MKHWIKTLIACVGLISLAPGAHAIILMATGDPTANTTEPAGELARSGWQWVGKWGKTTGVAVAPKYFLTVKHVGGNILDPFTYRGQTYGAVKFYDDPQTDLRLVLVTGTFPDYASLYTNTDELGRSVVVIGRGTQRGAPLYVSQNASLVLKGWEWGPADSVQRWGENRVSSILRNLDGGVETLAMKFDRDAGPNEAHASPGDSGGGMFMQDGLVWKLAGMINTTEGAYSLGPTGPALYGAVFDQGGLYTGGNPSWRLTDDTFFDQPGRFFCIRTTARLEWIRGVIGSSLTGSPPLVQSAASPRGPFIDRLDATVDAPSQAISFPVVDSQQFYRLRGAQARHITGIQVREGLVWLTYD